MAENEVVETNVPAEAVEDVNPETQVVETPAPAEEKKPSKAKRFFGGIKEWFRKFVVKLKRRPMNIAFFVLIVSTIVNLCSLGSLSQLGLSSYYSVGITGIALFVAQLFSILVIMLFLNSFPKRAKKPKLVMLIFLFVFMAVIMAIDLYLYITWTDLNALDKVREFADAATKADYFKRINKFYGKAVNGLLAHCILVGIAGVLTATYPLYGKLINKINTRKNLETTEIKEEIDTSAEV